MRMSTAYFAGAGTVIVAIVSGNGGQALPIRQTWTAQTTNIKF